MTPASWGLLVVFCSSLPVFGRLWFDNRHTSLAHAILWATLAWITWILTLPLEPVGSNAGPYIYLALALTGCAGIAVFGARRPGVTMWNAVVLALLLVELLPWGEALVGQKEFRVDGLRLATLAGALFIGVANYLPTRAFAAPCSSDWVAAASGCGSGRLMRASIKRSTFLVGARWPLLQDDFANPLDLAASIGKQFDRDWLRFRERFGVCGVKDFASSLSIRDTQTGRWF